MQPHSYVYAAMRESSKRCALRRPCQAPQARLLTGSFCHELLYGLSGRLVELAEEFAVEMEVGPEHHASINAEICFFCRFWTGDLIIRGGDGLCWGRALGAGVRTGSFSTQ